MINFACSVQGDYGYKIITVESNASVGTLIETAVASVAGYLVAPFPEGTQFEARVHGDEQTLADHSATVSEAGLLEMEAIDISVRSSK